MTSNLTNLSEIELIELFRRETTSNRMKSKIFDTILFSKKTHDKTWHQNITSHVNRNKYKLGYCDASINADDIYQEIMKAFYKMVTKWFNVETNFSFSTYAWYVINTAVDRYFQTLNTKKRKHDFYFVNFDEAHDEGKMNYEVVCNQGFGVYQTAEKVEGFEQVFVYKDIVEHIKNSFKIEEINEAKSLVDEIKELIRNKCTNNEVMNSISIKYDKSIEDILSLKTKINENMENELYLDIIKMIEHDVKDDGIVAQKHNCSRSQITKNKQKLAEIVKKELKKLEIENCF